MRLPNTKTALIGPLIRLCRSRFVLVWLFCVTATTLPAERFPRSSTQLFKEAGLVVAGRIVDLQISTERSHTETGFGNYDWAIDLTLQVTNVEKGTFAGDKIVARCFLIKSRKSVVEYVTSSGNHPIPAVGTPVRAHLYQRDNRWRVVFPNGLAALEPGVELTDADAVRQLTGGRYTYWLPIEIWVVIVVILLVPLLGWTIRFVWRSCRRKHGLNPGSQ